MRLSPVLSSLALPALAFALNGCGVSGIAPSANVAIRGNVHGGRQPIIGSAIQLWAAGTTDTSGNVTAASQLLQGLVTTDSKGSFSITGNYRCPSSNTQVYLTARGGDAGGGPNPQIVLMSLLGSCGALTPSTFAFVNEETTVMAAEVIIGTTSGSFDTGDNITGLFHDNGVNLASSFALALEYVNPTTGVVPGPAAPEAGNDYVTGVNTLADILAACINSRGGVAGDGSVCGNLFAQTTYPGGTNTNTGQTVPPGPTPTDTLQAIVDLTIYSAKNGLVAVSYGTDLYKLVPPNPPYIPFEQATPPPIFPPGVTVLAATATGDGVVHLSLGSGQAAAFVIGVTDTAPSGTTLSLSTSALAGTPASAVICQTNPNTGQCLATPAVTYPFVTDGSGNYTFAVFVTPTDTINSSPLYINLTDANSNPIGSASVLLTTN